MQTLFVNRPNQPAVLRFSANLEGKASRQLLDGVEHLVVPVVACKEGILNDIFYPADEIATFAAAWNGVPVPVAHPQEGDVHVSANAPKFEGTVNIGRFYNVDFTDAKLKGEIWIDIAKAHRLGFGNVVSHLQAGKLMEVSTGLFGDAEDKAGTFNGKSYSKVMKNIRPDHLALLPDEKGACSIEDGCGAMRANKGCGCGGNAHNNDGSEGGVLKTLASAILNLINNKGKPKMTKDQKVDALIANGDNPFTADDKAHLLGLEDAVLDYLVSNGEAKPAAKPGEAATGNAGTGTGTPAPAATPAPVTGNTLSADDMELFRTLRDAEAARRTGLRKAVVNAYAHLTDAMVEAMPIESVTALAQGIRPAADYSARAGAGTSANGQVRKPPSVLLANEGMNSANQPAPTASAGNGQHIRRVA